jgi:hypothetical protein
MTNSAPAESYDKLSEALHDGYQLTDKDIDQLALRDEEYKLQTWEDLSGIIGSFESHKSLGSV